MDSLGHLPPGFQLPLDVNKTQGFLIFVWIMTGTAAIILAARIFTAHWILRRIQASDYLMILAFISALITSALVTVLCRDGGLGRHIFYLNTEALIIFTRYCLLLSWWTTLSSLLARLSFCYFLLGIVCCSSATKYSIWVCITTQTVVNIVGMFMLFFQCGTHISVRWNPPGDGGKCFPGTVIESILYSMGAFNSAADLFLTVVPAILLRRLHLSLLKKMAVIFLLSLSIFALVASLIKIAMVHKAIDTMDPTWVMLALFYTIIAETYVVIIAASVPPLNALVKRVAKSMSDSKSSSLQQSDNSGQGVSCSTAEDTWDVRHASLAVTSNEKTVAV